jgi:hypothetical protein
MSQRYFYLQNFFNFFLKAMLIKSILFLILISYLIIIFRVFIVHMIHHQKVLVCLVLIILVILYHILQFNFTIHYWDGLEAC